MVKRRCRIARFRALCARGRLRQELALGILVYVVAVFGVGGLIIRSLYV